MPPKKRGYAESVAYVRVSSRAQDFPMQRLAIERAVAARGSAIDYWYEEKASGRTVDRPELKRLRGDARHGRIRTLYLYRIDRLTRSGIRDTLEVVQELRVAGVKIITVADGFDLDGPMSEIVLAMMAWASQMERLAINERISAARNRMDAEGIPWGRRPSLSVDEKETARALQKSGKSIRAIAAEMGKGKGAIERVLRVTKSSLDFDADSDGDKAADVASL